MAENKHADKCEVWLEMRAHCDIDMFRCNSLIYFKGL